MPSDNENFYDQHIAPKLAELGKQCQERGMSFIAMVEYDPGETGQTVMLPVGSSYQIRLAETAMRCHGNVDLLWNAIVKHAWEHGHNSIYLNQAGVPLTPEEPERDDNGVERAEGKS
jgi:hypothetical protein